MDSVAGRTVFITGGAQGIGLGLARAFASASAKVVIADIDPDALAKAQAELETVGEAMSLVLDVRDRNAFARAADAVEDRFGPVSILCNNAGVAGAAPLSEMSFGTWDLVLGINLGGVINGLQTFLPRMLARNAGGHVVNTSAGAGLSAKGGVSATGYMYQTSKYAIVGLSESLREHLAQANCGIGVTVLCPGPVPTNITANSFKLMDDSAKPVSSEEQTVRDQQIAFAKAVLAMGPSPDAVGVMTLQAVLANRLYVHTDRFMHGPIVARTEELLAAMPPARA